MAWVSGGSLTGSVHVDWIHPTTHQPMNEGPYVPRDQVMTVSLVCGVDDEGAFYNFTDGTAYIQTCYIRNGILNPTGPWLIVSGYCGAPCSGPCESLSGSHGGSCTSIAATCLNAMWYCDPYYDYMRWTFDLSATVS